MVRDGVDFVGFEVGGGWSGGGCKATGFRLVLIKTFESVSMHLPN